jgi:uncharacterized membrane protein
VVALAALVALAAGCGDDRPPRAGEGGDAGTAVPDACGATPCQNGGACTAAGDGGFTCACAPGYAGPTCASNVDDCLPNPCRNGGTCVDGVAGATCVCPPATTGARCELARFQPLGATPCGGAAVATAVSGDGRAVVGFCGSHAGLLWTVDGGFVDLGISSAVATDSIPIAVDADGGALASRFRRDDGTAGVLRWEEGGGTTDLLLQAAGTTLYANAASRDLGVLVGGLVDASLPTGYQLAFRFTAATGLVRLDVPASSAAGCEALAVSADGAVTAGACYDAGGALRAARWRTSGGGAMPVELVETAGETFVNGVSGDGRVLVGYVVGDDGYAHQLRFEGDGPAEDLGGLPDAVNAVAYGASFDGSVVVGIAERTSYPRTDYATVWDRANGMRAVADVLRADGIDTSAWLMPSATAISDDGKVIVGNGTGPDGIVRFWLARLD